MGSTQRVSISDIAKLANVSIGTVSNYLNYPERVSDTLKQRIAEAIADLGYEPRKPPRMINNIRNGMTISKPGDSSVGYVMTDIEHSLFTQIFEGIQETCEENDMQVLGANAFSDKERQSSLIDRFVDMNVAGILLSTVTDPVYDIIKAQQAHIPIILLDHSTPVGPQAVCSVMENNTTAGQLAAEELIESGCTHIMFVAHSFDYEAIQNRQLGIHHALEANKSGVRFSTLDTGGLMIDDGYQLGQKLCKCNADDRPDGIIAGSDALAVGLINAFCEDGIINVPEDISVIGCEGVNLPEMCRMPLSTIIPPANDMGARAMKQLLDEIENPETHVHSTTLLDPTLALRESTRKR